jgi:hypothetical protein
MVTALDGCREKIKRAEEHREELESEVAAWLEAHPIPFRAKYDPQTGSHIARITSVPQPIPTLRWGVIIGDVLHNLRSALDHLAWELAHWGGRTPPDPGGVKFPIADSLVTFGSGAATRATKQMDPVHVAKIESLQPYHPENVGPDRWTGAYIHPLAFVRDLSNADKHRLPTPILAVSKRFDFEVGAPPFNLSGFLSEGLLNTLEVGTPIMRLIARPEHKDVEVKGQMTPGVLLPESRGLDHLKRARAFVEKVVSELETLT